jgi:DNA-binding HxlR family transcriptional regulator
LHAPAADQKFQGNQNEFPIQRRSQGGKEEVRTGARALSLLSIPLNVEVLLALEEESRPLSAVRRAVGSPPPTTMRGCLRNLTELGVVQQARRDEFPGHVDLALGPSGLALLPVIRALKLWLTGAPDGQLELGTPAAKRAIKALIEGWSHCIVRAIAARPLSLTELDGVIGSLTYPSLERRLIAMRDVGQLVAGNGERRGTPYAPTDWLRRAVGPLAAAVLWERSHLPESSAPIARLDIEAAFLLASPLASVSAEVSGLCRLAVEIPRDGEQGLAGVAVEVREGETVACTSRLAGPFDATASGSAWSWLQAIEHGDLDWLDFSGDRELAVGIVGSIHGALFRASTSHQLG